MFQLDPRSVLQVDVENDASRLFNIRVVFESLCGRKPDGFIRVQPQQSLDALQHARVIVHH